MTLTLIDIQIDIHIHIQTTFTLRFIGFHIDIHFIDIHNTFIDINWDIWNEITQALYSRVGIEPMMSHAPPSGLLQGKRSSPPSQIRSLKKHVSMSQWTRHYLCHLGIVILKWSAVHALASIAFFVCHKTLEQWPGHVTFFVSHMTYNYTIIQLYNYTIKKIFKTKYILFAVNIPNPLRFTPSSK